VGEAANTAVRRQVECAEVRSDPFPHPVTQTRRQRYVEGRRTSAAEKAQAAQQ